MVASVHSGHTSAVHVTARFGSASRGDPLSEAVVHLGRLLRTVLLCDYFLNEVFRRQLLRVLNRGEAVTERFVAILIEHHRSNLPFWVTPEQLVVAPVSSSMAAELRTFVDDAEDTLARRIASVHKKGTTDIRDRRTERGRRGNSHACDRSGRQSVRSLPEATALLQAMNTD